MRQAKRAMAAALMVILLAGAARAQNHQDPNDEGHERDPGAAVGAALINIVYMPLRIVTTFLGAEFAGFVGFMTGGDVRAANDTFDLVNGSQIVTPDMLDGKEPFHVNGYD
jgi:hypothetical protein